MPLSPDFVIIHDMKIHGEDVEMFVSQFVFWDARVLGISWKTWRNMVHFSSKVSYNQDDISNFSSVHSGHVDIFVHDIL